MIVTIVSTVLIRLIPYLSTGVPYHTDTYAVLPLMDLLKLKTPTELTPTSGFDSYNVYWPGLIVYAVVHSLITGYGPKELTPITLPIINALSTLPLIVLLRSLGMSKNSSVITSLIFGLVGTESVLGAGVTKEGYALTIMMTVLALTSLAVIRGLKNSYYLLVITYSSLIITHHLLSVITLVMISYLIITYLTGEVFIKRLVLSLSVLLINSATLLTYIYSYSINALPIIKTLTTSDIISLVAYEYVATLPIILSVIVRNELRRLIRLWFVGIYVLVALLTIAVSRVEVVFNAPTVSTYELVLFTPYLIIALLGLVSVGRVCERYLSTFTYLVVLGLVGIELYLIFGTPGLISEAYRLSTFIYLGTSILTAYTVTTVKSKSVKTLMLTTLSIALLVSTYVVPYTAFNSTYVGGSQRVYLPSDIVASDFIRYYVGNVSVCGDLRLKYLLYLDVGVDVGGGLKYLLNYSRLNCYLVVNDLFREVGYVALAYGVPVHVGDHVFRDNSLVYVGGRNSLVIP